MKTIKRSILIKSAEVIECVSLKDDPNQPVVDVRKRVSQIITDDQLADFKAYCKASSDYDIIEDT